MSLLEPLDPWDAVLLARRRLPGVARVSGSGVEHQLDLKKPSGKNGIRITDLGLDVARFTIALTLWTEAQWQAFNSMRNLLQPISKRGKLGAVDVSHPALNAIGIDACYVKRVGLPRPGSVAGTLEIELECVQYSKLLEASTGKAAHTVKSKEPSIGDLDASGANYSSASGETLHKDPPSATSSKP